MSSYRLMRWLVIGILCLMMLPACRSNPPTPPEPAVVGLLAPLTGSRAHEGAEMVVAAEIAVAQANETLRFDMPIKLIVGDTQSNFRYGLQSAFEMLHDHEPVFVVGPAMSLTAIPAGQLMNRLNFPMIAPMASHPFVTWNPDDVVSGEFLFSRVYQLDVPLPTQAAAVAQFALDDLGATRAGILVDEGDLDGAMLASVFRDVFEATGGQVSYETYLRGERVYDEQFANMLAVNPDVLFLPNASFDIVAQIAAAEEAGLRALPLGANNWSEITADNWSKIKEGYYFSSWDHALDTTAEQEFEAVFRDWCDVEPVNCLYQEYSWKHAVQLTNRAMLTYDAFELAFAAIDKDRRSLRDPTILPLNEIKNVQALTGKFIEFDQTNHAIRAMNILRIEDGEIFEHRELGASNE